MFTRRVLRWRIFQFCRIRSFQTWNTGKASRYRNVDTKALNSALRPFYLLVHPDRFGNFPDEKRINEKSLTTLNSFLQGNISESRKSYDKEIPLTFFIQAEDHHNSFTKISLNIQGKCPVTIVEKILQSVGLPGLQNKVFKKKRRQCNQNSYYNKRPGERLVRFFEKESSRARIQLNRSMKLRNENTRLIEKICIDFNLKSLVVESSWALGSIHGYLRSLYEVLNRHKDDVHQAAGWSVVLGLWNGIDADGRIHLNVEDEPLSWVKLLSSVEQLSIALEDTENLIAIVSSMLGGLTIMKGVYQKNYHVNAFHKCLKDFHSKLSQAVIENIDLDLSNYKAILSTSSVEKALVMPSGSFLIPLSMNGFEIISFLKESFDVARLIIQTNQRQVAKELKVAEQCRSQLKLESLAKSSDIDHTEMISCCKNMLILDSNLTKGLELVVGRFYRISADGKITIPWNWFTMT